MELSFQDKIYKLMYPRTYKVYNDMKKGFKDGFQLIDDNHKNGRLYQEIKAPNGHIRHLNAFFLDLEPNPYNPNLKKEPVVYNRNDRQSTNSLVQGFASEVGCMGGYILNKLMTILDMKGIKTGFKHLNVVHDSTETEVNFIHVPIVLYVIENAYTNLVCAEYKKVFNYEMIADLSVEFDIGTSYATDKLYTWNYVSSNLKEIMLKVVKDMKEKGYNVSKEEFKQMWKNWKIVCKWRITELEEAVKEKKNGSKIAYTNSHWKDCFKEYIKENKVKG